MRFFLLCLCLVISISLHSETNLVNDATFEVTLVGQDAALCAGQCADYDIQIDGGTGPYRLTFSVVGGGSFSITDFEATEATLRICYDPTIGGIFLDSSTLPRVLRLPTGSLPFSIELTAATTETPVCTGDILFAGPFTISDGQASSGFTADIPEHICDTLILPAMNPFIPGVAYYTESSGAGTSYNVGDTLTFEDTLLPNGTVLNTLYIFDPAGNCGEANIPISIGQTPQLNVPPDLALCETYFLEPFSGGFITPQAQYATSRDFEAASLLAVGDSITSSTLVYIRDINLDFNSGQTCEFLDSFFIEIKPMPNTGLGQTIIVCSGEPTIIPNLFDLLGGNPDPGGVWGGPMLPGIDFNNPVNIDLTDMAPGLIFVFSYVIRDPDCGIFNTEIVFESVRPPFPGTPTSVSLCGTSDINFLDLLDNPEAGGFWNQVMGDPVNVGDGSSVDMTGLPPRIYQFQYSIISTDCPQQDALLEIDLTTGINAGRDSTALVCWMETIDLNTLLSSDADPGGTFLLDGFFPITNGVWNTSAVLLDPAESSRTIEVAYILDGTTTNCPNDTAFIEVHLLQNPFAGFPLSNPIQVCQDDLINLNELLTGEDTFGSYFVSTDLSNPIDTNWVATMNTELLYIVPGTGSCLPDTAFLNLTTVPAATVDFQLASTTVCGNECVVGTISRSRPVQVAIRITDDENNLLDFAIDPFDLDQVVFCPGGNFADTNIDTIFLGTATSFDFEVVAIEDVQFNCDNATNLSNLTTLNVSNSFEETLSGTVCEGGSTIINGVAYDASTDLNLQTTAGCDSIIHIVIDTIAQTTGMITEAYCTAAGPQIILGQTFDRDTSELITFIGEGANGCDSIALVTLTFSDQARGVLDTMICAGSSIEIDGETLQFPGTSEIDFAGSSSAGCDSLTVVTLSFRPQAMGVLDTIICSGDSFVKGFDTYNENNLMSMSLLQGASAFGCDSLLQVTVTVAPVTTEQVTDAVCGQDEIIINGNPYSAANPVGTETIQDVNGCDSIIYNIALQVTSTSAELSNTQLCDDDLAGTFDIESVSGLAFPLDVFVNGNLVTTLNSLPAGGLPADAGLNDITISDGNCSYETSIELVAQDGGNTLIDFVDIDVNNFLLTYMSDITPSSVRWEPAELITCTQPCDEAEISIAEDTEVTLILTLMNGCELTATTFLIAEEILPDTTLRIYDSNIIDTGSTDNDIYYIQSSEDMTIESLSIYDRWGNLVFINENFVSNDPAEGWNGRYNSEAAEQGVYVYRLLYTDEIGRAEQRIGNITLIR